MARGPDGSGGGAGFSLADQLFNADTVGDLARELCAVPGFDADRYLARVLPGLAERGLLERLEWMADAAEEQLPRAFPDMADALEAALPPPLDPTLKDDDFGRFIHSVPGILAVRHGLDGHCARALDLLHAATQRFSMELYIRPFLNRWPEETLARLDQWVDDENYHVRRLVSEGTRPRLPWAKNITIDPATPLRFLDRLHADPTRYVTRSVANHMNDLSKVMPQDVVHRLADWRDAGRQVPKEMAWLTRHALRTAVKRGERAALAHLGYEPGHVTADLTVSPKEIPLGAAVTFAVDLTANTSLPVMVDYRLRFADAPGALGREKVFKLKTTELLADTPLRVAKRHVLKDNATTFRLFPGVHEITVQVNSGCAARAQTP